MSESPQSIEALDAELAAALGQLEAADVALEERLRLHNRAAGLYRKLEERLGEARAELEQREATGSEAEETESYEELSSRLEKTVAAMEDEALPLGRVLAMRREALGLAARCEAILNSASGRIRNLDEEDKQMDGGMDKEEEVAPF